jgi:dihydropteroate synthase
VVPFTLNIRGELRSYDHPVVMGIINATPDSFYSSSRKQIADIAATAVRMVEHGAAMLDVGAYSSRPGAADVSVEEECGRLRAAMREIRSAVPDVPVSVDTFRSEVAKMAVEECGADIVNDISGGLLDDSMIAAVAALRVPYILMHMRGTPATMSAMCDYPEGVIAGVMRELSVRLAKATDAGICDIIIDPGLGFAKSVEQNYELLRNIPLLADTFKLPVLIGLSRKSMLTRPLGLTADEALPATVAANMAALIGGASIIRVHDVEAARQTAGVFNLLNEK